MKPVNFFYEIIHEDGNPKKVPYDWKKGEQKEYEEICNMAKGWGGIPLDVNWAKNTIPYREALEIYNKTR